MNWHRLLYFLVGSVMWAMLDGWNGRPANTELWMLAGLVMSWLYEPRKES